MAIHPLSFSTVFRGDEVTSWTTALALTSSLSVEISCLGERIVVDPSDSAMNLHDFAIRIFNSAFRDSIGDTFELEDRVRVLDIGDAIIGFYRDADRMISRLSCCTYAFHLVSCWLEKAPGESYSMDLRGIKFMALNFSAASFAWLLPGKTIASELTLTARQIRFSRCLAFEKDVRAAASALVPRRLEFLWHR